MPSSEASARGHASTIRFRPTPVNRSIWYSIGSIFSPSAATSTKDVSEPGSNTGSNCTMSSISSVSENRSQVPV